MTPTRSKKRLMILQKDVIDMKHRIRDRIQPGSGLRGLLIATLKTIDVGELIRNPVFYILPSLLCIILMTYTESWIELVFCLGIALLLCAMFCVWGLAVYWIDKVFGENTTIFLGVVLFFATIWCFFMILGAL